MLSSPGDINVKKTSLYPVLWGWCGGGGGGGGGRFIQTSTMTPYQLQYLISASVLVGVGQWLQTHFTLTMCVGTCMRLITMEMSIDVK